jgi:propionyl-CoA carboxylase alpha chain
VIRRLLVANRGEIARRVFRTCRDLGIETVAVHSDADAAMPFVGEADVAVRLPGDAPADTYLRADLLLAAAREAGADAVHPGYGFLSENADFARRVLDAGLTWIGPSPESIEQMGSKVEAKKLMAAAGVPVLPEITASAEVKESDLPLLVKASAGGGGRGMRVVRQRGDVADALEQASAEAASAFGDPTVFCEPYVESGRHVEVQVWGDGLGTVHVLGDRDCSVQRRHQKVVEEAPAPGLPEDVRAALHEAARTAAEAIDYVGAGTVEFLYDASTRRFWFLEMNTRLQVEHPVTECVTGLDVVALQLAAADPAAGWADGRRVADEVTGHAVEARLYAEDPANDWQPQSGRLTRFEVPADAELRLTTYGVRLDAGFRAGDVVGTHYDAMLAKVIAWAPTRTEAVRRLAGVLARSEIHGLHTNRDLLVAVLNHEAFVAGELGTDFLERHDLTKRESTPVALEHSAFAAAVHLAERLRAESPVQQGIPVAWRNVASAPQRTDFDLTTTEWTRTREGYVSGNLRASTENGVVVLGGADSSVTRRFRVFVAGDRVDVESSLGHVALNRLPRFADPVDQVTSGSLLAPMPGVVVRLVVEQGHTVRTGDPVLVLEAMKMQHTVTAPQDGVVSELTVAVGRQVAAGEVLAVVQQEDTDD